MSAVWSVSVALLEAAPDAILGVDERGAIVLANEQSVRMFGYPLSELIGQPVEILVPEGARHRHPAYRATYAADPHARPMGAGIKLAGRRKDGGEFPAEISLSPVVTDTGRLTAVVVRDVSDRERAEARFVGLLEAAPDAIVGVDRAGLIVMANAQAVRLFGYRRDDLIGRPIEILVPEAARQGHPQHRDAYFGDPRPRPMGAHLQLAARRRDGTEFPVEISLSALGTGPDTIVSAAIRDITERLELQAERERLKAQAERERLQTRLHQAERLESLGQLAGGVAHDFNNLLAVMLNYTAFVAEEVAELRDGSGDDRPSQTAHERWTRLLNDIGQIRRAGERATELTHQLLAFGRREVVRPIVLDLNTVLSDVEQLLHRTLGEHIWLHSMLAVDLWPVLADPGQIEQVIVNLAVNARDAMPDGGTLQIQTRNRTLTTGEASLHDLPPGRYVEMQVADTGVGMSPDVIERACEPFFTTKPKGEGTGLGLATIYGIVSQAGGAMRIASVPGAGTQITTLFPVTDAQPTRAEAPCPERRDRRGGETVLVVEDEEALREVTRRILDRNGYHVLTAADGAEAVKVADAYPADIDLLLTDVVMPKMLGKEVAAQLRSSRPDVRVLFMSGYAQPVLACQGTLDPGVVLIGKPFTEPDLLDRIRAVLDDTPRD
ncbi:PAS domain-containing hybrid sensor histidine kinase/response regulator [Virgisporangium ochraceum]|uniref:histidine kinase n=1 Tax=Virgisporangium ochraceum TaxID=65505 RepID=A0A8J3ZYN7_9ACTN|nr:PAS domain S-box protein [Virgisporangium ochraceum]GIJ71673.1 hypothetical protein Voc01_065900 [Virgisporangium ochraceum]